MLAATLNRACTVLLTVECDEAIRILLSYVSFVGEVPRFQYDDDERPKSSRARVPGRLQVHRSRRWWRYGKEERNAAEQGAAALYGRNANLCQDQQSFHRSPIHIPIRLTGVICRRSRHTVPRHYSLGFGGWAGRRRVCVAKDKAVLVYIQNDMHIPR